MTSAIAEACWSGSQTLTTALLFGRLNNDVKGCVLACTQGWTLNIISESETVRVMSTSITR